MSIVEYANRLQNTRTFNFSNKAGLPLNSLNEFTIQLPNNPYPQASMGSRAIFNLISFYITDQRTNQRASNATGHDLSGFLLEIGGLGFSNSIYTDNVRNKGNIQFFVPNKYALADENESKQFQVNSGGEYYGENILCSNPYGSTLNVIVKDSRTEDKINDNVNLQAWITFSIELIPVELQ